MPAERWLPVCGFEGTYEVSTYGQVRAVRKRKGRVGLMHGTIDDVGYRSVHLRCPGYSARRRVHKLVAEAFIGPCPPRQEVRHLDGDKLNNTVSNLAYGTRREQRLDDVRNRANPNTRKTHCDSGHEFTEANTRVSRLGHRECRACHREHNRETSRLRRARNQAVAFGG